VFSDRVGPVGINSASVDCAAPQNLVAARNAADPATVTVTWTAGADETQWKLQYGPTGFALGSGTTVDASGTTKVISGLSTGEYDFYVMAACSATSSSNWVGPVGITSEPVTEDYLFMDATINGTPYVGMKPYMYTSAGAYATNATDYGPNVLQVQGSTDPSGTTPAFSIISLEIPRALWHTGTYALDPNADPQSATATAVLPNIVVYDAALTGNEAMELPGGTITITEFNTATRRIRGTFSFAYKTHSSEQGDQGPFEVSQGRFDYPIAPGVTF
jgi:hypothetical protein